MTYMDYFEEKTNMKVHDYIMRYLDKALERYERGIVKKAWITTIERHVEIEKFVTPIEFVKYFNAVCKNMELLEKGAEW
ncbi:MAG: hypothetical protein ACRCTS_01720 [Fusobacteriaceae bacterium]